MDYWIKRNIETQERLSNKSIAQTNRQLRKYYKAAMERVIGDFEKTYDKIMVAAKDGKEVTPADLYKLDVYWTTQNRLREELQKLGDKQAALMSKEFTTTYQSIYNSLAIPSEDFFTQIDKQAALVLTFRDYQLQKLALIQAMKLVQILKVQKALEKHWMM